MHLKITPLRLANFKFLSPHRSTPNHYLGQILNSDPTRSVFALNKNDNLSNDARDYLIQVYGVSKLIGIVIMQHNTQMLVRYRNQLFLC